MTHFLLFFIFVFLFGESVIAFVIYDDPVGIREMKGWGIMDEIAHAGKSVQCKGRKAK